MEGSPTTSTANGPLASPAHHPPYSKLLLRVFRSNLSPNGRPHPIHLASIKSLFHHQFMDRYWFPVSWPRHVYQRLREMERKGLVESSGPNGLYFRIKSTAITKPVGRKQRKRTGIKKTTKMKTSGVKKSAIKVTKATAKPRKEQPIATPPPSSPMVTKESKEDVMSILSSFDFDDLESKLVRQMEVIGIVLEGLQSEAGLEWVAEAEMRLDSLLVGEHPESELKLDEMIGKIDESVSKIKAELVHVESTALLDKVEMIQRNLQRYKVVSETTSFSTLSILVASLLATIKQTKEAMTSSANKYESEIKSLIDDLEKSHSLLDLRGEQTQIHADQLELLKNSEASLLKAVDELRSALNRASEEFAEKMKDQQKLYDDDRNHYEEIIAGLEKQVKESDEGRRAEIEKEELENQLKLSHEQAKQLQAKLASYQNELQSLRTEMQETQERKDNEHEQLVVMMKEALGKMSDLTNTEEMSLKELLNSKRQTQNLIESTMKSID